MVYDFEYAYLYQQTDFAATLLGLYFPVALLAVIVGGVDYYKKRFEHNLLKPAYYSVLFLLASCRIVLVLWIYDGHKGSMMYFDLPSILLMGLCSITVSQVDKLICANASMRRRRIAMFLCNTTVCLAGFSYYVFSGSTPQKSSVMVMSFMESVVLLVLCCLLVWSFRSNWATTRFLGNHRLAGAFLSCGVCLFIRAAISISGVYSDFSPREKPSSSDSADRDPMIAPALIYYGVGECTFSYISLYIQYLLPSPRSEENITTPLLRNLETGKSRISELVEDYYYMSEDEKISITLGGESSKSPTSPKSRSAPNSPKSRSLPNSPTPNSPTSPSSSKSPKPPNSRSSQNLNMSKTVNSTVESPNSPHEAHVLRFLTLFEKSLNANNVVLHEVLGKGGSGAIVYRCTLREGPFSGGTFAVKVMKDCVPEDLDALMNEVRIYQSIKHNHIVKFMGADLSSPRRELRLFMEYIPHTLDSQIKRRTGIHMQYFTAVQVAKCMLQIVSGLQVLHDRNIIHRDIKTSNIFVVLGSQGDIAELKIGDFDVSTFLRLDKPGGGPKNRTRYHTANKGTEGFRAPEMVSRTLDKIKYDVRVDIWSLGMVLYTFLTLQEPYENENRFERGWSTPPTLTEEARGNPRYAKLIHIFEQCASPHPSDRPSCTEIASLLQNVIASSFPL